VFLQVFSVFAAKVFAAVADVGSGLLMRWRGSRRQPDARRDSGFNTSVRITGLDRGLHVRRPPGAVPSWRG